MALSQEELHDLSDDELEAEYKKAKAELGDNDPLLVDDVTDDIPEPQDEIVDENVEEEFDEEVTDDVEDEEDADETLEKSDTDSDDDASSDDDEDEPEDEDAEETEVDDLDGDSKDEETEPTDDDEDSEKDEQPVQKRKYKANGQDFEFSDEEIFERFGQVFGQSMNYTQKMQQLKPWRKTIDAIEEAELSHDDLNLAIEVLKGDKDAIASILKRTGVDALELSDLENTDYQPRDYGRNDTELDIKDIVDEISGDKEYAVTYDVLEKQWDKGSREAFVKQPELIRQLHVDVKSGMFDTISPIASKMKVYDGGSKSDLDYYKAAAQQYFNDQAQEEAAQKAASDRQASRDADKAERERIQEVKSQEAKRKAKKADSTKRKAAAPTKKSASKKTVTDYLDDSEEAFDDWYGKLQDSQ